MESEPLGHLLAKLPHDASFAQVELSGIYRGEFLDALRTTDGRPRDFSLSLVVPGLGRTPEEALLELRRLKKLRELVLLLGTSIEEQEADETLAQAVLAEHSSFRTRVLLAVDGPDGVSKLSGLVGRVLDRTDACLSVSIRDSCPGAEAEVAEMTRQVFDLAVNARSARFEECFPSAGRYLRSVDAACRGAHGSAYVQADGTLKPCRKSTLALGNLLDEDLDAIWERTEASALELCQVAGPEAVHGGNISLAPGLRPVLLGRLRPEAWGATLIKDLDCALLTWKGTDVVRALDGDRTLKDLRKLFGPASVKLVFALFMEGMVAFEG